MSNRRSRRRVPAEANVGGAKRDGVAVAELRALHALAVHLDAVGRVEVDDPVRRALLAQLRMPSRDVRVRELDLALARAAEHETRLVDLARVPVPDDGRRLALHPELLGRDGLGRLRR